MGRCRTVLDAVARVIEEHATQLSALDAAGGDGDHGMSMALGARGAVEATASFEGDDIGAFLDVVGKSLISGVGAAMGPLYGTALIRAGKIAAGKTSLDGATVAAMFGACCDGIVQRGKTKPGEKTMLDAFAPAAEAARAAAADGADGLATLRAASTAATSGAESTRDMIATRGRAAKLGERTRGHQDAGATSSALVVAAVLAAVEPQEAAR